METVGYLQTRRQNDSSDLQETSRLSASYHALSGEWNGF
jgi:hypothetical protein